MLTLRAALALLAAGVVAACTSGGTAQPGGAGGTPSYSTHTGAPDTRPNILFVLTDDLSTNLIRYMPHVLALQNEGLTMSRYYVVDSLCCPSRSAIFTGAYPHDTGVYTNGPGPDGGYGAFQTHGDAARSFAVSLHDAGYRTGFMGKYLNGYDAADPKPVGWDEWDVAGNGYPEFGYHLNEDGTVHHYGHAPQDYLTDVVSAKAGAFIDGAAKAHTPFALEVSTFAPHKPWVPAPIDRGTFAGLPAPRSPAYNRRPRPTPPWLAGPHTLDRESQLHTDEVFRARVESVQAVDRMIGHLEDRLTATGQAANTYVVFSSDNGFHDGEYGLEPGKQTAFDTDIRVPLIVRGPGVPAAKQSAAMASSIDLAPSFDTIAHASPNARQDGVSLLPLWQGAPVPATWQKVVLVEHRHGVEGSLDPDQQGPFAGNPPSYEAIRSADHLYVRYDDGEREYYDTATDPYELHNLAPTLAPALRRALDAQVTRLNACHGSTQCQAAAR